MCVFGDHVESVFEDCALCDNELNLKTIYFGRGAAAIRFTFLIIYKNLDET